MRTTITFFALLLFMTMSSFAQSDRATTRQAADSTKYQRRLTGWSIDAAIGPNFPLGRFKGRDSGKSHFAATGVGAMLNNHIMFHKVVGLTLGLGYEHNAVATYDLIDALRNEQDLPPSVRMTVVSLPFQQYTFTIGPTIRHMGTGVALLFHPYIGLNTIDGGFYSIAVSENGNYLGTVSKQPNPTTALVVGMSTHMAIHLGRSSDLFFGLRLNMAWRTVGYSVQSSDTPDPQFGWEEMELIRLAPIIGYRFHL